MHDSHLFERLGILSIPTQLAVGLTAASPLGHLLYRATIACLAYERVQDAISTTIGLGLQIRAAQEHADTVPAVREFSVWTPHCYVIAEGVATVLTSVVQMQNCLHVALRDTLGMKGDMKKSFDAYIRGQEGRRDRCRLPSEIDEKLAAYWNSIGKVCRDWRDTDHHYYPDASSVRVSLSVPVKLEMSVKSKSGPIDLLGLTSDALWQTIKVIDKCFAVVSRSQGKSYAMNLYCSHSPTIDIEMEKELGNGCVLVYVQRVLPREAIYVMRHDEDQYKWVTFGLKPATLLASDNPHRFEPPPENS